MRRIKAMTSLMVVALLAAGPVYAETLASTSGQDGYSMMGWVHSMGIVEQLQTIHRYSQSSSPNALTGLISALDSPFPLARRKAARSLLEKGRVAQIDQKWFLAEGLQSAMQTSDPIVMKSLVRLMAILNVPEAQDSLRHFFADTDKTTQLNAVTALSMEGEPDRNTLQLAKQATPYPEVRQAAQESLK